MEYLFIQNEYKIDFLNNFVKNCLSGERVDVHI